MYILILFYDRQKFKIENFDFMEESKTLSCNPMSSLDQCAKNVVSDSQWPADFVIGLVDSDPDPVGLGIQFSESLKKNVFLTSS